MTTSACRTSILIVEEPGHGDKPLAALLAPDRHVVRTVSNVQSALKAAFEWLPDVVFFDTGSAALCSVSELHWLSERLSPKPFVIVVGDAVELRPDCLAAGGDFFLVKPINSSVLDGVFQWLAEMDQRFGPANGAIRSGGGFQNSSPRMEVARGWKQRGRSDFSSIGGF